MLTTWMQVRVVNITSSNENGFSEHYAMFYGSREHMITSGVLIPLKDYLINKIPTIIEDDLQAVETNNMSDANFSDSEKNIHPQSTVEKLQDVLHKIKLGTLLIGLDDEDPEEKNSQTENEKS